MEHYLDNYTIMKKQLLQNRDFNHRNIQPMDVKKTSITPLAQSGNQVISSGFKSHFEKYQPAVTPHVFETKKSVDQVAIYSKLKEKDPIFGSPPPLSKKSISPRNWEYSPKRNITHEAVNFCTNNELEQRDNLKITSRKEPIYCYQKLDPQF